MVLVSALNGVWLPPWPRPRLHRLRARSNPRLGRIMVEYQIEMAVTKAAMAAGCLAFSPLWAGLRWPVLVPTYDRIVLAGRANLMLRDEGGGY